jgi:cytoskeletal protein RodZ
MFTQKEEGMDEKMQKKLLRQLRAIRFSLGVLVIIMVVGFGLLGFLVWKATSGIGDAKAQLQNLESDSQSITDLKNNVCSSGLAAQTTYCTNQ